MDEASSYSRTGKMSPIVDDDDDGRWQFVEQSSNTLPPWPSLSSFNWQIVQLINLHTLFANQLFSKFYSALTTISTLAIQWLCHFSSTHTPFWIVAAAVANKTGGWRVPIPLSNAIPRQWELCTRLNPFHAAADDDETRRLAARLVTSLDIFSGQVQSPYGEHRRHCEAPRECLKRPHTWHS